MSCKKYGLLMIILVFIGVLASCDVHDNTQYYLFGPDQTINKIIRRVETFPNIPNNYEYYNYKQAAFDLDDVIFSFSNNETVIMPLYQKDNSATWSQLGFWDDSRVGLPSQVTSIYYKDLTFGVPTYVGDRRSSSEGPYEGISTIPMVLGSSYVGIDKSNQAFGDKTYNYVDMTKAFYNVGTELILNTTSNTNQGISFWYDLYPQISFTRLYDLYQDDEEMKSLVIKGADRWLATLPHMVDGEGNPHFEFTGFDVKFNTPFYGNWTDVPNGGLAFIFYAALRLTGDVKYFNAVKHVLDYFQAYTKNPNYEAMTDYAPYVASIMNAEYGTNYDVQKFIEFLFENDSTYRTNWSILSGNYNGYPVDGLVGDQDYAFSMNSFALASTMAPMVKYDPRFAGSVGKYMLNLVNNAKWFFPREMSLNNQSMNEYLSFDPNGTLIYEGLRRSFNNISPVAMGDATTMFNQGSDLSIYSSSHIGYLGSIVSETNVIGILELDLNATDSFGHKEYPTHLYYNPYESTKTIKVNVGSGYHDILDSVTKEVIARNVTGEVNVKMNPLQSRVLVTLPAFAKYQLKGHQITVNNIPVAYYQAAVNITSPGSSRYQFHQGDVIRVDASVPNGDSIEKMEVYFGDVLTYEGEFLNEIPYSKDGLNNTDYVLRVIIYTKNGLIDQSSSRIIAL